MQIGTIAIATTKGGSGKTTLTATLAAAAAHGGARVIALDTDPNRNLSLRVADAPFEHRSVDEEQILAAVRQARTEADCVVIDVAGALSRGMLYAISAADVVIIPCKPDRTDVLEAARTQDVLRQAEALTGRSIPHAALLAQVNRRAQVTAITREQLTALGVPCMRAEFPHRTAYQASSWSGVPISDPAVRADIMAIIEAMAEVVSGGRRE